MGKAALIVMAAGIGSRFGGGIKQLEPIGPNGELIIDYSVYDAMNAGFDKVVFVIRKDLEKDFKEVIGNRIEKKIEVKYVFQEISDIPGEYSEKAAQRKKPWGTGQAVLCCKEVVKEPFLVINADDYYGKEAYVKAYQELIQPRTGEKLQMNMVGFVLENTLSENGTVTRGVCKLGEDGMLGEIKETYEIRKEGNSALAQREDKETAIPLDSLVSMNMWGAYPDFFGILETGFREFLDQWQPGSAQNEYLLPIFIGGLLTRKMVEVKVLHSNDQWFGVTYKEDKDVVVGSLKKLIEAGKYPQTLY